MEFSEDSIAEGSSLSEEEQQRAEERTRKRREKLEQFWDRIPSKERAMLTMKYLMGMSQTAIGNFYDISQGAVSYRLLRAKERIRIYSQQVMVDEDELVRDFGSIFKSEVIPKILEKMWLTSNQSETARSLEISQFQVRAKWLLGFNSISYLLRRLLLEEVIFRREPYSGQKMERVFTDIDPANIPLPADDSEEEMRKYEERKTWVTRTMAQIQSNLKVDLDYVFSPDEKKRFQLYYDVFRQIRENYHILTEKLHKWKKADHII
jgi:hypothetical protein